MRPVSVVYALFLATAYGLGLFLFTRGFFLTRLVISDISTCTGDSGDAFCSSSSRFRKAIVLIIDALRYDFATYNSSLTEAATLQYHNKLTIINAVLQSRPNNARLFKFVADPPTTTMQRLKALTTGSLPTFIDAGSNFASSEITEDNFIDQLVRRNKTLVFMGDDTWESLYPHRFNRSFPYPSFNVQDLDTVDSGVIENLLPQIRKNDWQLLIAHFLGVDHCGHRYGPYHPEMTRKLLQMNDVISSVIREMADDTLLTVMGDHGMTRSGDHGGDSADEVDAALFVYSPLPLAEGNGQDHPFRTVAQVDIVPTLSLLLGLPIPFSNIGAVISELFAFGRDQAEADGHVLQALAANAAQVQRYLTAYSLQTNSDLSPADLTSLQGLYATAAELSLGTANETDDERIARVQESIGAYKRYLGAVRSLCQNVWAKFDMFGIEVGLGLLGAACLASAVAAHMCLSEVGHEARVRCAAGLVAGVAGACASCAIAAYGSEGGATQWLGVAIAIPAWCYAIYSGMRAMSHTFSMRNSGPAACALVALLLLCAGSFSNSYVVQEDRLLLFVVSSLLLAQPLAFSFTFAHPLLYGTRVGYSTFQSSASPVAGAFSAWRRLFAPRVCGLLAVVAASALALRVMSHFLPCREESVACVPAAERLFGVGLAALPLSSPLRSFQYFASVAAVAAPAAAQVLLLRRQGNLADATPLGLCARAGTPLAAAFVCLQWALQLLPAAAWQSLAPWQQVLLPRCVYALAALAFVIAAASPLMTRAVWRRHGGPQLGSAALSVPALYDHVRARWPEYLAGQLSQETPAVYGLGSAYSAVFLTLASAALTVLVMLLGDAAALPTALMAATAYLVLHASSSYTRWRGHLSGNYHVPFITAAAWSLLAAYFFYATGHHATFPSIRWNAAFVGFTGDFTSNTVPALLVFLNTYSAQVFFALTLPLLLLWPAHFDSSSDGASKASDIGEMSFYQDPVKLKQSLIHLFLTYLTCNAAKLFATMLAAAVLRRHLMVWKIFAPRFVFEAGAFLASTVVSLLSCLLVLRVNNAIERWLTNLRPQSVDKSA